MSADIQWMEHRWGTRIELEAPVQIATMDGASASGVVRNASLSGALLAQTTLRPAVLSRIALKPCIRGSEWLEGCVVRVEANTVAIEWLDPPLHAVARLLSLQHESQFDDCAERAVPASTVVFLFDRQQAQG